MDAAEERWPLARGGVRMRAPLRALMRRTTFGHVLFVATANGYEIVESDDEPPPPGRVLVLFDRRYRVGRSRRSPFPGDPRPCFTVEPT